MIFKSTLTIIGPKVDLTAFSVGPICGDFDGDCNTMSQPEREYCAGGFSGGMFEADPVDNCPYMKVIAP